MRDIWSAETTLSCWLRTEATIARCQAELGIVPDSVAKRLDAVRVGDIDRGRFDEDMSVVGRPIVGLVQQLRELVGADLSRFVHFGTTTQDIMDTGMVLQMREGIAALLEQLGRIRELIEALDRANGTVPMIGRTNGQHAVPITFGMKLTLWAEELDRRREHLEQAAERSLMVQFGGPVGDLALFDEKVGVGLKQAIADRLGLKVCHPHWQNARDGVAELISSVGLLCSSLNKIARNVNLLSSSDIGELHETPAQGKGASSSMAHKRNQRCSEFAEAIGRLGRQRAEDVHEATLHEHERSGGAWIAEWVIVPQCFLLCSGALMWSERLFENLEPDLSRMKVNLDTLLRAQGEKRIV